MSQGWFYLPIYPDRPVGPDNRLGPFRKKGSRVYDVAGNEINPVREQKQAREKAKATAATVAE